MIDLGERRDGALSAAAARALFDRNGRRNAVDRIYVGPRGGLHELTRVGVQGFKIAALTLFEDDVKRERRFARTRHAGDHGEAVARYVDVDALEIMFARLVDLSLIHISE